jgi:NAD(P)-dependent dehydrogenase (short-subunit alcohol dehydrogenase family)
MPSILITGANRGLGLGFADYYTKQGWRVFACCRIPETASALQALAAAHSNLTLHSLDVGDFSHIEQLAATLQNETVDVLLANAGVYSDKKNHGFDYLDYAAWEHTLRINTLAPVKLAEAFLPHLLKSPHPLIVPLSSLMGSMADNGSGGSLPYRSSKAALNAAMKSLALDLRPQNIGVLILHPGWVKTEMGGEQAPTLIEESIAGMVQVIANFSMAETGCFIDFKGKQLPW